MKNSTRKPAMSNKRSKIQPKHSSQHKNNAVKKQVKHAASAKKANNSKALHAAKNKHNVKHAIKPSKKQINKKVNIKNVAKGSKNAKDISKNVTKHVVNAAKNAKHAEQKQKQTERFTEESTFALNMADGSLINSAVANQNFTNYIAHSVGKHAGEVITALSTPQTDEDIAAKLDMKINEVRRMLNALNSYGVTRYNVNKDNVGWLTFKWYVDSEKLKQLVDSVSNNGTESAIYSSDSCNDFFICESCYKEQKTIFPFETAYEMNFKCDCDSKMKRLARDEVAEMVRANKEKQMSEAVQR